jgi:signal transduction histidine kinase
MVSVNYLKYLLVFLFLEIGIQVAYTQDSISILLSRLEKSQPSEKVDLFNRLAFCYNDTNITKSIYYSQQAIEIANSVKDTSGLTEALYNIAYIQFIKGDNNEAFKNMTNAYNYFNISNNKIGIARSTDILGLFLLMDGSLEKSFAYHLKALMIFNELYDTTGIISATNNLGIVYRYLGNINKAITYHRLALELALKTNNKLLSTVYNSMGSYYSSQNEDDSALIFFRKVINIQPTTFQLKDRHCAALHNIGNIYRKKGNLDSAIFYFNRTLKESSIFGLSNITSSTLKNFGIIYDQKGNSKKAIEFFNKSMQIAKENNLKRIIAENYLLLSGIFLKQGDYKQALDFQQKYSILQDSIFSDDLNNKMAQFDVDFLLQQKEKDQAVLLKNIAEQKLQIEKSKYLNTALIIICSLLFLISLLIYRLFKLNKNSAFQLKELNEELEQRVEIRTQKLQQEIENHEITAIALVKERDRAEESDRLKTAFLANLSHEIRTPMNAILGFTDLLSSDISAESQDRFIAIIHRSGQHLLNIINDIIEISKIEAGHVVPNFSAVNLNEMVDNLFKTITTLQSGKRELEVRLIKPGEEKDNLYITDEVKLLQILNNLINNAFKFTESGYIEFGYEIKTNNEINFIVSDTGVGIEEKYQNVIFERFRQVEGNLSIIKGGSGLGLAISKAYVELLGGKIKVESEIGKGSVFSFTIPLVKSDKKPEIKKLFKQEPNYEEEKCILIVEDDILNCQLFEEILTLGKYQFEFAANGFDAVVRCRENKNIQLVLMDIKMPVMNGFEALTEIRKIRPELKVIAQTAYALPEDIEKIKKTGFDAYINKPIVKEELLALIKANL